MGLDVSHGAFSAPYSAFNRLRVSVAKAWGGSFPPHTDKSLDTEMIYFPDSADKGCGLYVFMTHSDCEGEISPEDCKKIADEMSALLPLMAEQDEHKNTMFDTARAAKKFIAGCLAAHQANEPLEFA